MAGDTPAQAVVAFVEPLQEALSCFVSTKVTADRYDPYAVGVLTVARGEWVRLPGPARISLSAQMRYEIVETDDPGKGPWKVSTRTWIHHLKNADGVVRYAYHWHPDVNVADPHVHVDDDRLHVITGRIMLEDVLQLATEMGVEPVDQAAWEDLRRRNREAFHRGATWGHGPT